MGNSLGSEGGLIIDFGVKLWLQVVVAVAGNLVVIVELRALLPLLVLVLHDWQTPVLILRLANVIYLSLDRMLLVLLVLHDELLLLLFLAFGLDLPVKLADIGLELRHVILSRWSSLVLRLVTRSVLHLLQLLLNRQSELVNY